MDDGRTRFEEGTGFWMGFLNEIFLRGRLVERRWLIRVGSIRNHLPVIPRQFHLTKNKRSFSGQNGSFLGEIR